MSWTCSNCDELNDDLHKSCWQCKKPRYSPDEIVKSRSFNDSLICSTTAEVPGRKIESIKSIVFGETILAANIIDDLFAGFRDIAGGRSGIYEDRLQIARNTAIEEMLKEAHYIGANAVVGVKVDYETVHHSMMMICASGTAVVLHAESEGD